MMAPHRMAGGASMTVRFSVGSMFFSVLLAAAKQRNEDQHRNRNAEQPQEDVADPAVLLAREAHFQGIQAALHQRAAPLREFAAPLVGLRLAAGLPSPSIPSSSLSSAL